MRDATILRDLSEYGIAPSPRIPVAWNDALALLAAFDAVGQSGCNAVIKIDGERTTDRDTVVLSGGLLGQNAFRKDGAVLSSPLGDALAIFVTHAGSA
jgi:hypothetical protein